jgi:hypothetical protein
MINVADRRVLAELAEKLEAEATELARRDG